MERVVWSQKKHCVNWNMEWGQHQKADVLYPQMYKKLKAVWKKLKKKMKSQHSVTCFLCFTEILLSSSLFKLLRNALKQKDKKKKCSCHIEENCALLHWWGLSSNQVVIWTKIMWNQYVFTSSVNTKRAVFMWGLFTWKGLNLACVKRAICENTAQ